MTNTSYPNAAYPSATNTFVPNHAATGALVVGFSRNANSFACNNYMQIFPVSQMVGLYLSYTSRNAARILTSTDTEHLWPDAATAPSNSTGTDSFQFLPYLAQRRCYSYTIGELAVDQAEWNLLLTTANDAAQQAMTARTMLAYNALSGASWGNNTASVQTILGSGLDWSNGSVGFPQVAYPSGTGPEPGANIKKSLQYASQVINLATIGAVDPQDLTLVISPTLANVMAASTEVQDYIKQSPDAMAQLRGDKPNQNGMWGLPTMLYGYNLVVDKTVRVSSSKGATSDTLGYVYPATEAYLLARPGQLVGLAGSRSYSTLQMFTYKDELTVENMYDNRNKRYEGRVISNYQILVASVYTGFKFTSVLLSPPTPP